jgi:S-adenosylmethionine:tRNA ribosyltransferase-isomerase
MNISEFDYVLPPELIAQTPIEPRDRSRLMVLSRHDGSIEHHRFYEIAELLSRDDVLVFNDSQVIPARLMGHKKDGGGRVEVLLLRRVDEGIWETLLRPAKRLKIGTRIEITTRSGEGIAGDLPFSHALEGEVVEEKGEGVRLVRFCEEELLEGFGEVALPPYIHLPLSDPARYQTVYARVKGSVAAPTAGLHFTPELLEVIKKKGVQFAFVTLHVGLDTFRPVRVDDPRQHQIHQEYCKMSPEVASKINAAKGEGKRIVCVGTTTARALEQAALQKDGEEFISPFEGWADLFILPGHRFLVVDSLITNFHLPRSTLLMLVSAFASTEYIQRAYEEAIRLRYHFYSFGDAMLIL